MIGNNELILFYLEHCIAKPFLLNISEQEVQTSFLRGLAEFCSVVCPYGISYSLY